MSPGGVVVYNDIIVAPGGGRGIACRSLPSAAAGLWWKVVQFRCCRDKINQTRHSAEETQLIDGCINIPPEQGYQLTVPAKTEVARREHDDVSPQRPRLFTLRYTRPRPRRPSPTSQLSRCRLVYFRVELVRSWTDADSLLSAGRIVHKNILLSDTTIKMYKST